MIRSVHLIVLIGTISVSRMLLTDQSALTHQAIIHAPVADVWKAFTTREGLESWMVPHAEINLRVGGVMRSTYNKDGVVGDESTIENTIISYLPERMLSFRNTGQPKGFLYKQEIEKTWSVLLFEPIDDSKTRLTITGMGYGDDQASQQMRAFFQVGNQAVLDKLKSEFATTGDATAQPSAPSKIDPHLAPLSRYVGGQWVVKGKWNNGTELNGREIHDWSLNGSVIRSRTFLPKEDRSEYQRYEMLTRWDSEKNSLVYQSVAFDGAVSSGTIEVLDDGTLLYPPAPDPDGKPGVIRQTLKFTDDNTIVWNVYQLLKDGGEKHLIEATWKRQSLEQPPAYQRSMTSDTSASAEIIDPIDVEAIVNAPLAEVWNAWTTNQGAQQFFAPKTEIDLRLGGDFHILFNPNGEPGTRGAESEKILSYQPMRMLSFEWGAPPQFAHARAHACTVVVLFGAVSEQSTRVRLVHHGFTERAREFPGHAEEYRKAREYFAKAWPTVLSWCQRRFDEGPRFDASGDTLWK
jgi:uncharacterized protein YndB with AHSA1/START domain